MSHPELFWWANSSPAPHIGPPNNALTMFRITANTSIYATRRVGPLNKLNARHSVTPISCQSTIIQPIPEACVQRMINNNSVCTA